MHAHCPLNVGLPDLLRACIQHPCRACLPPRRGLRLVVHAEDSPSLAARPTLRAPPKKPTRSSPLGPRKRLEQEQQQQQRHERDDRNGSGGRDGGEHRRPSSNGAASGTLTQRPSRPPRPPPSQGARDSNSSTSSGGGGRGGGRGADARGATDPRGGRGGRRGDRRGGGREDDAEFARRRRKAQMEDDYRKMNVGKRRETRETRRRDRAIAREAAAPVRQEIFEVGEDGMLVEELADTLAVGAGEIVKILFLKGIMVQVNSVLDRDAVKLAVEDFEDVEVVDKEEGTIETAAKKTNDFMDEEDLDHLMPRPPVVTIMGHVDHGKTSLLDFIRKAKVAAGEAGGITQAIGAYTVQVPHDGSNSAITFLDTPGHEAFSAMRARGTKVTDMAIIVVAADDGVRPQTQEAISHAKAAEVPIVVALNKIDKEGAQPERVKQELADIGLLPEEWGGETAMVPISAKHGQGVDALLEQILLQAEVEELTANPSRAARGTVIEAHLDRKRGPVATLLVQAGTLRIGDMVVASASYGKVKSLAESTGDVEVARPSIAVQMVGLNSVPTAGDEFFVCEDEAMARKAAQLAEDAQRMERLAAVAGGSVVTTKSWASIDDDSEALQRLNIILKADASGTLEAVKAALGALPQDNVMLRYLLAAANQITTSDVDLASASEAVILGFNAEPSEEVAAAAKEKGVELRSYRVIYDLVDDVRAAMEGRLNAVEERKLIGEAEVRATFGAGNRVVAGCMINEGVARKGAMLVVTRGRKTVFEGPLVSLRRVKDDVKEVSQGLECGIRAENFTGWKEGDKIRIFEVNEKRQTLEEAATPGSPDASVADSLDN